MAYNLAPLQNLIDQFERMQGIGHKTAQRMAFYVLGLSDSQAQEVAKAIKRAEKRVKHKKLYLNRSLGGNIAIWLMMNFVRFAKTTRGIRALFALLRTREMLLRLRERTNIRALIMCSTVQFRQWTISVPTKYA